MRQNSNARRSRGRGNRKQGNSRNQVFDSNGPGARVRGNSAQVYEKYQQLARDASSGGDRVAAEGFLQHAEHYYRLMVELGINLDENSNSTIIKHDLSESNEKVIEDESAESSIQTSDSNDENDKDQSQDESIESVPFISEPIKKKRPRSTK